MFSASCKWPWYIILFYSSSRQSASLKWIQFFLQGREEGGGGSGSSSTGVGYGKSPEWVEVDGMIVSRGGTSLHLTSALNSLHNSATSRSKTKHGSVLSLPYSSRTLLTYNSASSTTQRSSGRSVTTDNETLDRCYHHHHHRPPRPLPEPDTEFGYDDDEEPPYETIPSVPPNINFITTKAAVLSSAAAAAVDQEIVHHDDSVISAHDTCLSSAAATGIYNYRTTLSANHLHGNNIDLLRKKLLMQDANETRLW